MGRTADANRRKPAVAVVALVALLIATSGPALAQTAPIRDYAEPALIDSRLARRDPAAARYDWLAHEMRGCCPPPIR